MAVRIQISTSFSHSVCDVPLLYSPKIPSIKKLSKVKQKTEIISVSDLPQKTVNGFVVGRDPQRFPIIVVPNPANVQTNKQQN